MQILLYLIVSVSHHFFMAQRTLQWQNQVKRPKKTSKSVETKSWIGIGGYRQVVYTIVLMILHGSTINTPNPGPDQRQISRDVPIQPYRSYSSQT